MQIRTASRRALRRSRTALIASVCLFVVGLGLSALLPTEPAVNLGGDTPSALFLIRHNLQAVAFLWSGVATLGITTIGGSLLNGAVIGSTLFASNVDPIVRLALFVPHAIFELPALWIAGAAGFRIPLTVVAYLRDQTDSWLSEDGLKDTLVLGVYSAVLLVCAAFVEAYVTPVVAAQVL